MNEFLNPFLDLELISIPKSASWEDGNSSENQWEVRGAKVNAEIICCFQNPRYQLSSRWEHFPHKESYLNLGSLLGVTEMHISRLKNQRQLKEEKAP